MNEGENGRNKDSTSRAYQKPIRYERKNREDIMNNGEDGNRWTLK